MRVFDLFSLEGRVALVTGGDKGLGAAMAIALADAGAGVAVTSRSGAAADTLAAVQRTGRRGVAFAADFSDGRDPADLIELVVGEFGRLDILVNNAGTIRRADVTDYSREDWNYVMDVNLNAVWALSQAAARIMLGQGGGKIINITSLLGFQGGIRVPAYAAAKHALTGLTRAMANELAAAGINVNAIAPGYMATDNTEALRNDPARSRQLMHRIPARRWGAPHDLAGAAVYLASQASDYVHGHVLSVDGGWMAR